jgi:hypothetical protein
LKIIPERHIESVKGNCISRIFEIKLETFEEKFRRELLLISAVL